MSELFENNNNAGKDVPSMTQVQMEEEEEEEFYPSKRHTNNANSHDNMVEMTQIQMDDESSSGEDVCGNDDEMVFDNENDTMLIDEDDISGVINDSKNNENSCSDGGHNNMPPMKSSDKDLFKAPDMPDVVVKRPDKPHAPSPGSAGCSLGIYNNGSNTTSNVVLLNNDTIQENSQQQSQNEHSEGNSEELSLFLSQSQKNVNEIEHESNNSKGIVSGENQGENQEMGNQLNHKNGDRENEEMSLQLSLENRDISTNDQIAENSDSNGNSSSGGNSSSDINNDSNNNNNNDKSHAISQISQLEIDHESEYQIANMAEIAVRDETIPQQKDQMLLVSQSQSIENTPNLILSTPINKNTGEGGIAKNGIRQLMAYIFQKLAFIKLKKNMHAVEINVLSAKNEESGENNEINSSLTQPHLSISQPTSTHEKVQNNVGENVVICINHNNIDSQGMISLSYESSAYEESQSQAKIASVIARNTKIHQKKGHLVEKDAVVSAPLKVTQPGELDRQNIKCIESSLTPTNRDGTPSQQQLYSNSIYSNEGNAEHIVEETPQSQYDDRTKDDENAGKKNKGKNDSGGWISTTATTDFKKLKKDYFKNKDKTDNKEKTEIAPLRRNIRSSSLLSGDDDDEEDEIEIIAKGNISDMEDEEELPSETAMLDVSENEENVIHTVHHGDDNSFLKKSKRSRKDENDISDIIVDLFPKARENDIGIKSFYLEVKKISGKNLNDELWIPYVWDAVFELMNQQSNSRSMGYLENPASASFNNDDDDEDDDNIPLSQVGTSYVEMSQESHQSQQRDSKERLAVNNKNLNANINIEKHEEWSLAAHRNKRHKEGTSTTTTTTTKSTLNKKRESKGISGRESKRKKILNSKRDSARINVWKLADAIHQEDLSDVFLKDDERWRDLFYLLKLRGWTWVYGSGVIEKKYLVPGASVKTGIMGTTIFHSARDVVNFVRNNEPKPSDSEIFSPSSSDADDEEGEDDLNISKDGLKHVALTAGDLTSSSNIAVNGNKSNNASYNLNSQLIALLKTASKSIGENANGPKGWKSIFNILKSRGWEYKKAPKVIALKCAWVYIEPASADNNAKNPILHEGERDTVKALCRRFNIDVPSSPVLPSRRRKKRKERTKATPKRSSFEEDLAKAIQQSKKKLKVQATSSGVKGSDDNNSENKRKKWKAPHSTSKSNDEELEMADKMKVLCKAAAEHDDIATDPPGWKEIFEKLQGDGWYYKNSSSGLRAWDYVAPSDGEGSTVTIYPNPRAVARAICDKIGVVYDAPTESQENNRSRRSRRPPKRFVTPQTPKELKKKEQAIESIDDRKETDGTQADENVSVASKKKKGGIDLEELASSPSNFKTTGGKAKIAVKKSKDKKIFSGFHFMFSGLPTDVRKSLKTVIKRNGGFVYSEISTFENDMKECEKTPVEGDDSGMSAFVVLSLCEPSAYRKAKYLYSLAVGVPVVHYSWINKCLLDREQVNILKYVLPNGLSMSRGMYVFPSINDNGIQRDGNGSPVNVDGKEDLSILSPKPSNTVLTGVFNQMKIGLHSTSGNKGRNDPHTDWWHILNIAGASVYEGGIDYLKKVKVDTFVCRMDDFGVLPELRKLAKRKKVPIVTFEWCIQSLIDNAKLEFDLFPTFGAGKAAGSSSNRSIHNRVAAKVPVWASAMLTIAEHTDRKYFTAVRINGVRYCIGDLVYMQRPWLKAYDNDDDENEEAEGKSNNKYQFRLGIIESFWEMKNTGEKKVKWKSLDRINAGNGNIVVATGEFVESPIETMSKKFMMFEEHQVLIPSNDSSDVLASKTPSAKSLRVSVTTTTTTSATNSFSADCPLSTSRSYFQIKSEEDDGYYEIIADEIHDVYFLKAFDETL